MATQRSTLDMLLLSDFGRLQPNRAREIAAATQQPSEKQIAPSPDAVKRSGIASIRDGWPRRAC